MQMQLEEKTKNVQSLTVRFAFYSDCRARTRRWKTREPNGRDRRSTWRNRCVNGRRRIIYRKNARRESSAKSIC